MPPDLQVPEPSHGTLPAPRMLFLSPGGSISAAEEQCLAALEETVLPWSCAMELGCLESVQQKSENLRYFLAMVSC